MMPNHFAEERWVCTEFQGISVNRSVCFMFPLLAANRLVLILVLFCHSRANSFSESVFQTCCTQTFCIPGFGICPGKLFVFAHHRSKSRSG